MSLKEFIPNQIWIKEIPLSFLGVPIGARMTIIRLSNDRLFLQNYFRNDVTELKKLLGRELPWKNF